MSKPWYSPHPYQERAITWIHRKKRCALFLPMGSGKTPTTLEAVRQMIESGRISRILVIGPKRVVESTWPDEIEKWENFKDLRYEILSGTPAKRLEKLHSDANIFLIGKELTAWLCDNTKDIDFDMIIIDELSAFKSATSKRFKAIKAKKSARFLGLTGTPAPKSFIDLWPQIWLLDHGKRLGKTITAFRRSFCYPVQYPGMQFTDWKLNPGAEKVIQKRIDDLCMSISMEEYATLPEATMIDVPLRLSAKEMKDYQQFRHDLVLDEEITASNAGVLCAKLLQYASGEVYLDEHENEEDVRTIHSHKIEALCDLVEQATGNPVMVFYWFKHERWRIIDALKKSNPSLNVVWEINRQTIQDFNDGKIDVLLLQPSSAGHGLNLQKACNIAVWYTLAPWNLELYQQANARIHRQGQKNKVTIYHLLCKGTIDEVVLKALNDRDMNQKALLDYLKK